MSFRSSDSKLNDFLDKNGLNGGVKSVEIEGRQVRYMYSGNVSTGKIFLFIHGAPGSLDMFKSYHKNGQLKEAGLIVSVDRPGYGYSGHGNPVTSIMKQAEMINEVIEEQFAGRDILITGHSLGAPIAAAVAYLNPEQVSRIILAAGAVVPEHEKFVSLARVCNFPPIRWISWKDTRVATDEKLSHVNALREIEHIWKKLDCEVIVQHGTSDRLVPYSNVAFLENQVSAENLYIEQLKGKGHLYIMDPSYIVNALLK